MLRSLLCKSPNLNYKREGKVLELLKAGITNIKNLKQKLEDDFNESITESDFMALIYAMRKERLVKQIENYLKLL